MAENTESQPPVEPVVEKKSDQIPLTAFIKYFLLSSYVSIIPAVATGYFFFLYWNPIKMAMTGQWLGCVIALVVGGLATYAMLVAGAWVVAKAGVRIVTKGKPILEGTFENSYTSKEWRDFSMRHVAKKFSMWLFQHRVPRWLYRKYVGSFIKLGKHCEIPEWIAMELGEIGDNTVCAQQGFVSSHFIDGPTIFVKKVTVGKNCIIDSQDETCRTGIGPGAVVEDNVIVRPGTLVPKNMVLKEGGIYQGETVVERVGNVSDLSDAELKALRDSVRKKRKMKSRMIDEWSSFHSRLPRVVLFAANLFGLVVGLGIVATYVYFSIPAIISAFAWFEPLGHVLNILILTGVVFISYGIHVYIPMPVFFSGIKHYRKVIPEIENEPGATLEITDPAIIESWKCMKWLKWQAIDRVNRSLFLDTSNVIYQHIGRNNVAFATVLYVAKVDTDYVTIGDNTLLSFGGHIYAYTLSDDPPRLVIKPTTIGCNCVLATSIINAGARIGDGVLLGLHSVVPEDCVLESGKTYAGNPALEWEEFKAMRKELKSKNQDAV